jgi:hypothetical protein
MPMCYSPEISWQLRTERTAQDENQRVTMRAKIVVFCVHIATKQAHFAAKAEYEKARRTNEDAGFRCETARRRIS